jgi:hypothetical protein
VQFKRVILVRDSPYSSWEEKRFGVNVLRSLGLEVELWNVGPIFQPLGTKVIVEPPKAVNPRDYCELNEYSDSCSQLTGEDLLIFMCGFTPSGMQSHLQMWQIASKCAARLAIVVQGGMPRVKSIFRVENFTVFLRKLRGFPHWALAQINRKLNGKVIRGLQRKFFRLRSIDYIWAGTSIESVDPVLVSCLTKITSIHNFDYDEILDLDLDSNEIENVALYIDHMGYNHPDFFSLGYTSNERDDSVFFSQLECAFKRIEQHYGVTVEIAAHPRAAVNSLGQCYPNRTVHHHQTLKKVKNSKILLLTSASTVVAAAADFEVPMIGLVSRDFHKDFQVEITTISQELKFPILEINQDAINWPELVVNEYAYKRYVGTYLKLPGTNRLKFWEEVGRQITSSPG